MLSVEAWAPDELDLEILYGLAEGESFQAIRQRLRVGTDTLASRVIRLKARLGARSQPQLVAAAYHHGILRAPAR